MKERKKSPPGESINQLSVPSIDKNASLDYRGGLCHDAAGGLSLKIVNDDDRTAAKPSHDALGLALTPKELRPLPVIGPLKGFAFTQETIAILDGVWESHID